MCLKVKLNISYIILSLTRFFIALTMFVFFHFHCEVTMNFSNVHISTENVSKKWNNFQDCDLLIRHHLLDFLYVKFSLKNRVKSEWDSMKTNKIYSRQKNCLSYEKKSSNEDGFPNTSGLLELSQQILIINALNLIIFIVIVSEL